MSPHGWGGVSYSHTADRGQHSHTVKGIAQPHSWVWDTATGIRKSARNLQVAVSWELPDKAKPLAGEGRQLIRGHPAGHRGKVVESTENAPGKWCKVTLHREICRRDCKFSQAEARLSAKICCRALARADPEGVANGGGHVTATIAQNGHLIIGLANSGPLPYKITIFFGSIL
ncbi:hypothetical protein EDD15DRAFT_2190547 [Pisolithus albus]|nr:hypothetical protein EDD15DRAFT_2190547 [Pisolithus albus]